MRKLITIGLAAITLAASAGVGAASAQPRPYGDLDRDGVPNRYDRDRDGDGVRNRNDRYDNGYGRWDNRWGRHPAPPPRHWRHNNSWYGHVRACQIRYRSYNPARDMYFTGRVWTRCRL
ncbi:MAG: BA14K family protein [Phenylobacterium sp.]|uniref:BA14K family protein n=1 Tax=Phenylobacterium sp. TaxID=1871053 RepID=UPI001B5B3807|nr:BA14K family protein [Phenylobacterium sp.]MBP7649462.1 BA14K family protein [Phenylobacterium sp.]MBP7817988.1 BA14K family protein [Phenylobacterium sp.]MBP9232748.1 BA14K family protein [Phenylobacterium sp.]MBP9756394.1 BA14K family protein [Phenylobacterium sp.]